MSFCSARTKRNHPCRLEPLPDRGPPSMKFCLLHWTLLDEGRKLRLALGGHCWLDGTSIQFRFGPPPSIRYGYWHG